MIRVTDVRLEGGGRREKTTGRGDGSGQWSFACGQGMERSGEGAAGGKVRDEGTCALYQVLGSPFTVTLCNYSRKLNERVKQNRSLGDGRWR